MVKIFKNIKRLKLKIASIFMLVLLLTLEFSPFAVKAAAEKLQFYSAGSVPVGWDSYNNKNVFYGYSTLGGIIAYCVDYTCALPSGTMTFERYLSDQAMAVLINGYPYRSAADMGLASNEEAYFATQMALWEVLNRTGESHKAGKVFRVANVTPKSGMEDFYSRTTAAAARLVSLAETSPFYEIPNFVVNTESAKLSNIGTDALFGPYYLRVDGINTSTVKSITAALEGAPASARITDENGNDKTSIGNGDAVYVRMSGREASCTFNVNFHTDVDKVCGRIYTTGGAVQDYCIVDTVPVGIDNQISIKWTEIEKHGQIKLVKVDQDDQPVSGAKFRLSNADTGEVLIDSVETGDSGVITFTRLPAGNYILTEIEAPYGYQVVEATKNIKVEPDKTSEVKMVNERITGRLVITKVDDEAKPLANVTFEIYDYQGKSVQKVTTDENGKASVNVGYGTYYFKEISCPEGYIMDDTTYRFKVDQENRTFYQTVTNESYKGSIVIIKKDDAGQPIQGVKFDITDAQGNVLITLTTNKNGKCGAVNMKMGTYYYQETYAPAEYKMDNTKHEFKLTQNNEVIERTVVNNRVPTSLKIKKVNDDDREIPGVKFNVLDSNKNVIETLVTDNNGEAISKELTPGTYYYKEVEVPSPYILDTTEYKFEVVAGGELVAVKVVNHKAYGKLEITKYDTNQKVLSGVKFNILDENDNVVDTIVTNENGVATSKDLVLGKYFYKEIEAPSNVIMDQNKYEFVLTDNGQVIKKNVINKLQEFGTLEIRKYDSNGEKLSGVKFNILNDKKEVVETIVTDADGRAQSSSLPLGTYYYQETEAPDTVVMDSEIHEFKLAYNGNIVTKTVINKVREGKLHIIKKDESDKPVAGVKFEILDMDMKKVTEIVTDENGDAISEDIEKGTYYYREIEAPKGLVIDDTLHKFTIEYDGQNVIETMVNNFVKGKLRILKLEDGTTQALSGAKFAIVDADKNIIAEIVTDENGYAETEELLYGTYVFKEIEAPKGYILDSTEHEFTIDKNGDIVESVVYNEKTKLPKTGGLLSDNMMIIIIVSLASMVGYGFMKLISAKKENN